jgi:hypothetical protein
MMSVPRTDGGSGFAAGAPRFFTSSHGTESSATWLRNGLAAGSRAWLLMGRVFSSELAKSAYRLLPGGAIAHVAAVRSVPQRQVESGVAGASCEVSFKW